MLTKKKFYHLMRGIVLSSICGLLLSSCVSNSNSSLISSDNGEWDLLGGGSEADTQDGADTNDTDNLGNSGDEILDEINDDQKDTDYHSGTEVEAALTISESGNYKLSGTINGQIKINVADVKLYLDNCNIINIGKKVIDSKYDVIIILMDGSLNSITNTGEDAAEANAISGSGNITINGAGTLSISSSKSAIKSDAIFYGLGGNLEISAGTGHGISADTCIFKNITLTIDGAAKDGIHTETEDLILESDPIFSTNRGYVYIGENANINIQNIYGDGIQADTFVLIEGGNINISSIPVFVKATSSDSCYKLSGGVYTKVAAENSSNYSSLYQLAQSNKGIKVGEIDYVVDTVEHIITDNANYSLIINDGVINIATTDDGLHSNSGNLSINGGTIFIETSDDGIAADKNLKITNGNIIINKSYEGIEGETIDIIGGNIKVTAIDDGINASSNASTAVQKTTCYIKISGGRIYVNSSGDGIDSNGGVQISGGELYVYGPASGANASLDSETGILVSGGIIIAIGTSGMVETPATNSTQYSVSINLSSTTSGAIDVLSGSNSIISFSPIDIFGVTKNYQSIVLSSPNFQNGATFSVISGSKTTSVTISSIVTKVGSSAGGGGKP